MIAGGGEMIADVYENYSTYAEPPSRFDGFLFCAVSNFYDVDITLV